MHMLVRVQTHVDRFEYIYKLSTRVGIIVLRHTIKEIHSRDIRNNFNCFSVVVQLDSVLFIMVTTLDKIPNFLYTSF